MSENLGFFIQETSKLLDNKHLDTLIHFVTNRCNARCSFCFIDFDDGKMQSPKNELTIAEIDLLTKSLGGSIQHVNLTGGEPFLRKDLVDIVRCYFKNAKLSSILVNTNGSFPERIKEFIQTLAGEFPDKRIVFIFSIDSFSDEHDRIRKVPKLFSKTIESYNIVRGFYPQTQASVNLTCTHENYQVICEVYDMLIDQYGIDCFSPIIARTEGMYKIPREHKEGILQGYKKLTQKMLSDIKSGRIQGFNKGTLMGKYLNAKNAIQYNIISETYLQPEFRSYCPAGSIFGVVQSDWTVYPCEILDKPLGNLRDYNFDFLKLWHDAKAAETKKWIKDTKCNCHWECAWTYNILSNPQYLPKLIKHAAGAS